MLIDRIEDYSLVDQDRFRGERIVERVVGFVQEGFIWIDGRHGAWHAFGPNF